LCSQSERPSKAQGGAQRNPGAPFKQMALSPRARASELYPPVRLSIPSLASRARINFFTAIPGLRSLSFASPWALLVRSLRELGIRDQRSEIRSQKSEVRNQKSEVSGQ
jgi:hypothetical protein